MMDDPWCMMIDRWCRLSISATAPARRAFPSFLFSPSTLTSRYLYYLYFYLLRDQKSCALFGFLLPTRASQNPGKFLNPIFRPLENRPFFNEFLVSIFGRSWTPTWGQLGLQNRLKSMKIEKMKPSQDNFIFSSIFYRFLASTSTPRTLKIIVFPLEKRSFLKKTPFEVDLDLGGQLGANLPPFWPQKSTKVPKNPIPRSIQKLIDFCFDFGSFWGPNWGPSWGQVGHQHHQKTPKNASKTPPGRLQDNSKIKKTWQKASKTPQEAPRAHFEAPRGHFRPHFGWFLAFIFTHFSLIFDYLSMVPFVARWRVRSFAARWII